MPDHLTFKCEFLAPYVLCEITHNSRINLHQEVENEFFLGYLFEKTGWKVCNLETWEIFVSEDVVFQEHIYPFDNEPKPFALANEPKTQLDFLWLQNAVLCPIVAGATHQESQNERESLEEDGPGGLLWSIGCMQWRDSEVQPDVSRWEWEQSGLGSNGREMERDTSNTQQHEVQPDGQTDRSLARAHLFSSVWTWTQLLNPVPRNIHKRDGCHPTLRITFVRL